MSTLSINTTQNVNIDFTAASVGDRILAYLLDMLVKGAYIFIVMQVMNLTLNQISSFNTMDDWSYIAVIIVLLSPVIFYTLLFETFMEGQTPGKKVLNIKVVKIDGFQASFPDYLSRWITRIIDITMMSGVIALLSIILSNKNQRLGDMVAGTSVISLKNRVAIHQTILMEIAESYQPKYPAAAYLSDKDARIIKKHYEQAIMQGDYELIQRLRTKVETVLGIEKENVSDPVFISDILRDFNYYTRGEV